MALTVVWFIVVVLVLVVFIFAVSNGVIICSAVFIVSTLR